MGHTYIQKFILITIFLMLALSLEAQTYSVKGCVRDEITREPVEMAVIGFQDLDIWLTTNQNGEYFLSSIPEGEHVLIVSFISYIESSFSLNITSDTIHNIFLKSSDILLKDVIVRAKESKSSNTSSRIDKEAIAHLQPSSISDLMELLPGNSSHDPHLSGVNMVSMRQVNIGKTDINTSLGTSFIIDGAPLSNDASMQSISGAWERKVQKRNTTGLGVDMRKISTDEIESIEIVRGIPSVRYGDLSSGLINIKRKKGRTPLNVRLKSDPSSKMMYVGKGFNLNNNSKLNLSIDYLSYTGDPRNKLETYKRLCSSIRYSKRYNDFLEWNTSLDYTGSFDDDKQDKEINYGVNDYYSSSYNNLRLSQSIKYKDEDSNWLKSFDCSYKLSYTKDFQTRDKLVSLDRDIPWTRTKFAGENDGVYLPNEYQAYMELDSQPLSFYSQANMQIVLPFSFMENQIMIGVDYKYDKNLGKGELIDAYRPAYTSSSRPRAYSDIPSLQRISVYLEDNINIPLGEHSFNVVGGLRASQQININSKYTIANKIFLEPRVNAQWKFPSLICFDKEINISINAGVGKHTRLPVMSHLYPSLRYYDLVQLNYYHQNKDYRRVNFLTKIVDPTNYQLSEATNSKWEIGLDIDVQGNRFSFTFFNERLNNGFRTSYDYQSFIHKKYDNQSIDYSTITDKPSLDDMTYVLDQNTYMYSQQSNGSLLLKKGLEFQCDFKKIDFLSTNVSINGAWLKTTYSNSQSVLKHRNKVLNGESLDYIGIYDWDSGSEGESLNTNIRFDTQISSMGLIFSTLIECEWYKSKKHIPTTDRPVAYIDKKGDRHLFTQASADDYQLQWLILNLNENTFKVERTPFSAYLNLKISKKFKKNITLSMYVNRLTNYLPSYERNGFEINRKSSPYFGMELRISI